MTVTNANRSPSINSASIPPSLNNQPAAQRHAPRSNWDESSINTAPARSSCFSYISQCLGRLVQWIKEKVHYFFGTDGIEDTTEPVITQLVTPQELDERVQKGRKWIEDNIDEVFGNGQRDLRRDKFLVEISYKGMKAFSYPTSNPANLSQLKNDAMTKLEALIRSPVNAEDKSSVGARLSVSALFFTRFVPRDDKVLPFIRTAGRHISHNFMNDSYARGGIFPEAIADSKLNEWLADHLILDSVADRRNIINYVSDVINS